MMEGLVELSKFVYWGFGICVTGFFALVGWLIKLQTSTGEKFNIMQTSISEKVSYKWIEEKFEKDIKAEMQAISTVLIQIKDAVAGDMEKPGIISRLRDVEREVVELKEK